MTWSKAGWGRIARVVALSLSLSITFANVAAAQEPPSQAEPATADSIVLDFQNAPLGVVLSALAEMATVNVMFTDLPARTVTLRTSEPVAATDLRGYIQSIAETYDLELHREDGLVRIRGQAEPTGNVTPTTDSANAPVGSVQPRLYVLPLAHAEAASLGRTLSAVYGGEGAGSIGTGGGGFLSLSEELRQQRFAFADNARQSPASVPPTSPGEGGESRDGLRAALSGPVRIVPDPRTNSLLILAAPADYETIQSAVDRLDTRPLQVLIEVMIAEVRRDDRDALGIGLEVPEQLDSETGLTIGGSLAGGDVGDLALNVLGIGAIGASTAISALASSGDVTILSRPVLLAQNNQEARVLVGSQRPFIKLFRALPTDEAVRDQVVQYRNVGTQLTIRPTINDGGYVSLRILQEISTATNQIQFGAPIISTREMETQLLVKNGHTAVLGGLANRQHDYTESGIPILKDIPLIGRLFGSSQDTRIMTELFIFITPHVLRTDADLREATRELRNGSTVLGERLPDPMLLITPDSTLRPTGSDSVSIKPPLPDSMSIKPALPDSMSIKPALPDSASIQPFPDSASIQPGLPDSAVGSVE